MSAAHAAFVEALTILIAMSGAGLVHALWMLSPQSRRFAIPIDGGRTLNGRRVFGDHKTMRGFMAIVPAAGFAFMLLGVARDAGLDGLRPGLWGLDLPELFALGAWAGFCFMAGELPNSFLKRRWGIAPGHVPGAGARRIVCLVVDRLDSTLALLVGMTLFVDLRWQTWLAVLLLGPAVHFGFSGLLYLLGVKRRYA